MAEGAEAGAAGAPPAGGGGGGKLVLIISLVNMLASIGMIAVLLLAFQKEKAKPSVEDIVAGEAGGGHGGGHGAAKAEGGHGGGHGGGGEHGGGGHGDSGGAEVADAGKIIALEPFTINLASAVGTHPRYIRLNVSIELEPGGNDKEFEIKTPRVRDTVLNLVNSKKAAHFNSAEGRQQVKEEIRNSVNSYLLQAKVKDVYITNFAISQ